jgi:UDP-glucose 4-epimerase
VTRRLPPPFGLRPHWLRDRPGRRLAVVGADGFIGSHAVWAAIAAGLEVSAVCLRPSWRLAGIRSERLRVASRFGDAVNGADAVALLAYTPPPTGALPDACLAHERSVNVATVSRICESTDARVVFASSADVYGSWHEQPVREEVPPSPRTAYAVGKLEAEELLTARGNAVSLRISTVFGPSEHERRAIPSFIRAFAGGREAVLYGDGSDVRDYVHVSDVAAAVVEACFGEAPEEVLNVGSGVGRRTADVLNAVAAAMDVEPAVRFEPQSRARSRLVLDVSAAARALGVHPRDDFEAALAEEIEWLRAELFAESAV